MNGEVEIVQNSSSKAPELALLAETPLPESDESRPSKRGGKRPGAGRKPNLAKRLLKGLSRAAIAEAMQTMDVGGVILSLLKSKRERTKLETLVFVWDRLYGRPAQNMNVSGSMVHAHTIWRPLESLTDEEIRQLDTITKKLTTPASNALPDAPHNQTESKPAIAAEIVASPQAIPVPDSRAEQPVESLESRERAQRPESVAQVPVSDGEESEEREPRSIMETLNRPTREPVQIGESWGR